MHWLSIFYRFVPAIVAGLGGSVLVWIAPSQRKIQFTVAATALGLICMEWEYLVAGVFSVSMVPGFLVYLALTAVGLLLRAIGCLCLGKCGLLFGGIVPTATRIEASGYTGGWAPGSSLFDLP